MTKLFGKNAVNFLLRAKLQVILYAVVVGVASLCFYSSPSWKLKWAFLITCCLLSVVCLSVCKLFTFSTTSQEPLGQFQLNLAQSILGFRGFKFVQMKGQALLQGEIIMKLGKFKNILLLNHWTNFNTN